MVAALRGLINVLYHKFVFDANRLAYWLGKLVDMAPRKLALCKYFPYLCFLYTSFCAVLSISEVNSRHSIHSLTINDACFSTFNFSNIKGLPMVFTPTGFMLFKNPRTQILTII